MPGAYLTETPKKAGLRPPSRFALRGLLDGRVSGIRLRLVDYPGDALGDIARHHPAVAIARGRLDRRSANSGQERVLAPPSGVDRLRAEHADGHAVLVPAVKAQDLVAPDHGAGVLCIEHGRVRVVGKACIAGKGCHVACSLCLGGLPYTHYIGNMAS